MATLKKFQFVIISCLIGLCLSQVAEKFTGLNPCTEKTTCRECIQTLSCAWCSQPDFGDQRRCFQPSMISDSETCMEKYIYQPDNKIIPLENRELTKGSSYVDGGGAASANASSGTSSDNIVQIKPQRVKLALRINEALKLEVFYSQAEDYPVDLYYLMDLSKSMEDDKDNLSKLGGLLSDTMRKMTSNFRLGFGSFVDKVVMPYVSMVPKNLAEPCPKCASPYGFRNVMKLSVDTDKFATQVEKAAISGNLDAPEGGFDAIMQAVVCRNEIGWREKARRLLVFSTDAGFHYAGDGKLGGIVKPNDGQCHLDGEGLYTHSSLQDYPSISQLNLKVKDNAINLIFAVTGEQISIYDRLKEHIEGSSAGKLSNDSSNVVDFVKEQYSKISSSVEMKDNSTSAVNIKYYSSCLEGGPEKLTSKCDGLKVGDRVKFTAEITVTSCPEKRQDWNQIIQIYPVGIKESLIIDLEMLCDCPCERPGNDEYEENSAKCHNAGAFSCGICECDSQHFGQTCECSADTVTSSIHNDTRVCKADNVTTVDCSGRGTCTCGQCKCHTRNNNERITGKYCECDNFSCDRHNGLLCSGETHGKCECGRCVCNEDYTGKACDCLTSTKACIPPGGGEVCSGHGTCHCGQCSCDVKTGGERYSGPYCDYCPTCSSPCEAFIPCIECQAYETGPLMDDDSCSNCSFVPASAQIIIADDDKGEHLCSHVDADDCRFSFVYGYNNRDVYVRTQEKRECPPQVFMLGVVLGVIAAIVFIGLALLLLWKMVTTIHDRREFAKFEKERSTAKWDTGENPIYKQATSTFRNPTYSGR